jgi:hypothetical protein
MTFVPKTPAFCTPGLLLCSIRALLRSKASVCGPGGRTVEALISEAIQCEGVYRRLTIASVQ